MIIKEMTATFGKLDKATLRPGPGMNVLRAANEAGKSTWSAFLRAMLYGIPTGQRDKTGFLAEKNRYAPWSGAPMEGSMTLDWNGREVILRRRAKGSNPFGSVQAVDGATGEAIPELCVEKPGEVLLGVEREVFERSAFVGQTAMTVDGDPALEKRVAALLTSGQEEVSFSRVQRQLKDWRNRRQHNRTGLIPKLEEEIGAGEALLRRAEQARLQEAEGSAALDELRAEKRRLEEEKLLLKSQAEREKWERYRASCQEYQKAKEEYDALEGQFRNLPSGEDLLTAQQELQRLQAQAAALRLKEEELRRLEERGPEAAAPVKRGAGALIAAALAVLAVTVLCCLLVGALVGRMDLAGAQAQSLTRRPPDVKTIQFLAAGLGGAVSALAAWLILRGTRKGEEQRRQEEKRQDWEEEVSALRAEAQALRSRREEELNALLRFVHGFAPTVSNEFGISAALSRALRGGDLLAPVRARLEAAGRVVQMAKDTLESERPPAPMAGTARFSYQETVARLAVTLDELARKERMAAAARGELRSLGDVDAAEARLEEAREELRARKEELAALDLAMEAMEEANSGMQARFSPALNQRAGELMSRLTGGKYDKLTLTRTFEAVARQAGEVLPHSVLSLSRGTADQLYLAVRLAVCDLALPAGAPLVLDDALIHFDDERMALALDCLRERAGGQQIFLFSCHSRETEYLRGKEGVTLLV